MSLLFPSRLIKYALKHNNPNKLQLNNHNTTLLLIDRETANVEDNLTIG